MTASGALALRGWARTLGRVGLAVVVMLPAILAAVMLETVLVALAPVVLMTRGGHAVTGWIMRRVQRVHAWSLLHER